MSSYTATFASSCHWRILLLVIVVGDLLIFVCQRLFSYFLRFLTFLAKVVAPANCSQVISSNTACLRLTPPSVSCSRILDLSSLGCERRAFTSTRSNTVLSQLATRPILQNRASFPFFYLTLYCLGHRCCLWILRYQLFLHLHFPTVR